LISTENAIAPSKGIVTCASEAAAQVSVAGGIQALGVGTSGMSGFITNALGGNAISGLTDLIQSFKTGEGGGGLPGNLYQWF
jgi:hypothetical protein